MLLSRAASPGGARTTLGARVDALLPWPERRAALRGWRRRRPFWGGLLLAAAGVELLVAPLSPLGVLFSLGVGGIAAVVIGLALILAGVFLWAAPHARAYVSLNALLLSVAAFAVTNLGGFLVGSLLGVAGSALGFAWTPVRGEEAPSGAGTPSGAGAESPRTGDDDHASGSGSGGGDSGGSGTGRRALAVLLPFTLLAVSGGGFAAPRAQAAEGSGPAVTPGARPTVVTTSRFSPEGFLLSGVEEIDTREGPLKVLVLRMKAATLTDYTSTTRDPQDGQQVLGARNLELRGNVTLYVRKFHGCIEGSPLCVTFSPEGLPTPPVVPPFVFMTRVRAEQALVTTDSLNVTGLRIRTTDGPPPPADIPDAPLPDGKKPGKPGKPGEPGESGEPAVPAKPGEEGAGGEGPGEPEGGGTPDGVLAPSEPRREPTAVPWCEKVTLTVTNNGGRPVSRAQVRFDTDIVDVLGRVRASETAPHALPGTLAPGGKLTRTWKVCVPERHIPGFLLGRRLEHRATVTYPGGRSEAIDVPRR